MRRKLSLVVLAVLMLCAFFITACSSSSSSFKVSFMVDGQEYSSLLTDGNEKIVIPKNPEKEGYTFDGWYWDEGVWKMPFTANSLLEVPISSDLKVYAKFTYSHVHDYTSEVIAPTCTEEGYTLFTCACGDVIAEDYVNALGHTETEVPAVEATCSSFGYTEGVRCALCYEILEGCTEIAKLEHQPLETNGVEATCTTDGYTAGVICSVCNEVISDSEVIEALGHVEQAVDAVVGDCTTDGVTAGVICSECGTVLEGCERVVAIGYHTFGEWVIDYEATANIAGQKHRDCIECDYVDTVIIVPQVVNDVWDGTIATNFAGGNGTETSPYEINTASQLAYLAQQVNNGNSYSGYYFILNSNIDLSNFEWTPIGIGNLSDDEDHDTKSFKGNFNGNGNTISNLIINTTTYKNVGLFGIIKNAKIEKLSIVNAEIVTSQSNIVRGAILVGAMNTAIIEQCHVEGNVSVIDVASSSPHAAEAGLITGQINGTNYISNSYGLGDVYGQTTNAHNAYVGGLVGSLHYGSDKLYISNCYFNGIVEARGYSTGYAGGLVGIGGGNINVSNCFVIATITSNDYYSGIVTNWSSSQTVTNSYYYATFSGSSYHSYGTSTALANLQSESWIETNLGWDFEDVWTFDLTLNAPVLKMTGTLSNHSYIGRITAPTCTERGYITYTCEDCQESYVGDYVDALGHTLSDWIIETEPTCVDTGLKHKDCTVCGETHIEQEEIEALGHTYGEWIIDVEATCIQVGEKHRVCSVCEYVETVSINGTAAFDVWDGTIATGFAGGDGTETSPYEINTASQLAYLAQQVNNGAGYSGYYFILTGNIDLNNIEWTPIGIGNLSDWDDYTTKSFKGNFDGNGNTISNLKIDSTTYVNVGLFGVVKGATIEKLSVINASISNAKTSSDTGAIFVGHAYGVIIDQSYAQGSVSVYVSSSGIACAGAFVGRCEGTNYITSSYAEGDIFGQATNAYNAYVGGLVGDLGVSDGYFYITDCYFNGNVDANASGEGYAAGILGANFGYGIITNCFAIGTVTSDDYYGSIICKSSSVTNSYYSMTLSGSSYQSYGTSTALSNLQSESWLETNLGWDFENVWTFNQDGNYPVLQNNAVSYVPHDYVGATTAPTCTEQGYTTYTCSVCEESYVGDYVDALGHTLSDWIIETESTCTEQGLRRKDCTVCEETYLEQEDIEALGHTYGEWIIDVQADYEQAGEKHRVCFACNDVETAVIPMLTLNSVWDGTIATAFESGTGTEANPYVINTASQLAYLAQQVNNGNSYSGYYFILTNNIDLDNLEWTPIGKGTLTNSESTSYSFAGNFDGLYHNIYQMNVNNTYSSYSGLFGVVLGDISNLGVCNSTISVNISYETQAGNIAGFLKTGTISNCYAQNFSIESSSSYSSICGGIVGLMDGNATATNCYAQGSVGGNGYIGGIVGAIFGTNGGGYVSNCYFNGDLMNTGNVGSGYITPQVAGIGSPMSSTSSSITNCFFIGTMSSSVSGIYFGAINGDSRGTSSNCYYYSSSSSLFNRSGGTSTALANLQSQAWIEANLGWDFEDVWCFGQDSETPVLVGSLVHVYESVVTEPTCETQGYTTYTCSDCGHSYISDYVAKLEHDYQEGACVDCEKEAILYGSCGDNASYYVYELDHLEETKYYLEIVGTGAITSNPWSSYSSEVVKLKVAEGITDMGSASLTYNVSGSWITSGDVIYSPTIGHSSSTTYRITFTSSGSFSYEYRVSSESGYDYLTIKRNGEQIHRISGTGGDYTLVNTTVSSGEYFDFIYSKDSSATNGYDKAYIKLHFITNPFSNFTELEEIIYEGTSSEWEAIEKASNWDSQTGEYIVKCSDVTVDKDGQQVA